MLPDIHLVSPDLKTPPMVTGEPAAGRRVRQVLKGFERTAIHHALYLPRNWRRGRKYPVIVEYAGNGDYRGDNGDVSTGTVEGSNLGYGISGGGDFIWACLPFVNRDRMNNEAIWWGDVDATADYCKQAVRSICSDYGGDPAAILLAGFSRGAIDVNFIGLHDDEIAGLWAGFIAHSHYDGVLETWPYPAARPAALRRLQRLKGRPVWISHEDSVEPARRYVESSGVAAPFTFVALPYRNHTDAWVLRDIPERNQLRQWVQCSIGRAVGS